MRHVRTVCVIVALGASPFAARAIAQAPRVGPGAAASGRYATATGRDPWADADMLRPYGSRASSGFVGERSSYSRPAPQRPPAERPPARPRAAIDYFPTMRPGSGPNRNVVDVRSLCNPGRRALLLAR